MSEYTYQPVDSSQGEIRLLTLPWDVKQVLGRTNVGPLTGTLTNYRLPISSLPRAQRLLRTAQLPSFYALSYVWGESTKPREILIDGKSIPITQNLYDGLRALQKTAYGLIRIWADALCICQDDTVERSAQIMLMREIYQFAGDVCIWLGPNSEDGTQAFKFIDTLTAGWEDIDDPVGTEDSKIEESIVNVLGPFGAVVRGACRIDQTILQISDVFDPAGLDDKAEIIIDPDSKYSLNETKSINSDWRPSARRLTKVKDFDFNEIAILISRIIIQNEWFSRMWVVQVCTHSYLTHPFYHLDLISD
jgi:Heterokaryon incompatibility protein (HET)